MPQMIPAPTVISIARANLAIELAFLAIPVWTWSMTCIKTSVALSILRIKDTLRWKVFLYAVVALQAAYCVANTIFVFQVCRPLSDWWDITAVNPHCDDANTVRIMSTTGTLINVVTDVLLALSPLTFLWTLQRPVRERILVCLLMGMGLFATSASIVKMLIVLNWVHHPDDDLWSIAVAIATWTTVEQFFGLTAACLPFLKPLVQRCLGSVGISVSKFRSNEVYSGGPRGTLFRMKPIPVSSSDEGTTTAGSGNGKDNSHNNNNISHPASVHHGPGHVKSDGVALSPTLSHKASGRSDESGWQQGSVLVEQIPEHVV